MRGAGTWSGPGAFALALSCVSALLACGPTLASAHRPFAPLRQPGPPLNVPKAKLRSALTCAPGVPNAKVEPVLLSPATGVTPDQNYSWNWEPALNELGIPWCAYKPPDHTLGDIQVSGEYIVWAIRHMYRMAGHRIAILGQSQGGMSMRWALRFWPGTRKKVRDVVGMAATNHGTTTAALLDCPRYKCPAAVWQQANDANFIRALNSRAETFKGVSYTEIYTHTDEVATPNSNDHGTSSLHTGQGRITNVATQDLCPLDLRDHNLLGTVDPVAYALAVDALTHRGPARPSRIPGSVCAQLYMPGVNPLNVDAYVQVFESLPGLLGAGFPGINLAGVEELPAEPKLARYVHARRNGQR